MDKGEEILSQLSPGRSWEKRSDGWWLETRDMDVEKMAHVMIESKARLVTITAHEHSNGEVRIIYHWDLEDRMLNMVAMTDKGCIPSIAMVYPASDWMEREIHEYFAVQFNGRESSPLYLNPGDSPGIFLGSAADRLEVEELRQVRMDEDVVAAARPRETKTESSSERHDLVESKALRGLQGLLEQLPLVHSAPSGAHRTRPRSVMTMAPSRRDSG